MRQLISQFKIIRLLHYTSAPNQSANETEESEIVRISVSEVP